MAIPLAVPLDLQVVTAAAPRAASEATTMATHQVGPALHVRHANPVAIAMLTVGGASVLAGLVVGFVGFLPASTSLDAACPERMCPSTVANQQLFDHAQRLGWAANLTVGIGAVYVAAGALWLLAERSDGEPARVRIAPMIGASGFGLFATGRF